MDGIINLSEKANDRRLELAAVGMLLHVLADQYVTLFIVLPKRFNAVRTLEDWKRCIFLEK